MLSPEPRGLKFETALPRPLQVSRSAMQLGCSSLGPPRRSLIAVNLRLLAVLERLQ